MSIDRSKKMYLRRFSILEKAEENNKIFIWYELPFWIYVNKECAELINYISGRNFEELIMFMKSRFTVEINENELMDIIETLHQASALYYEGEDRLMLEEYSSYTVQYITFNITNACNLFCSHCYIDSSNKRSEFMSIDAAKTIIDKLNPYMIDSCRINVSGGEAMLNKDVFEILKYFRYKNKGKLNLVTNGTLITKNVAKRLKDIDGLKIQVSLDGASKKVHEKIRGKNTYEKTLEGISNLIEQGHTVYLSPIVTFEFFEEIEEYFELAKKLGIKAIFLQPVNNIGRAKLNRLERVNNAQVFKKVVQMYEDDPELINYIPGTLEAIFMSNIKMLNRLINCGTGMGTLAIQPNGDCFPCPNTITDPMYCGNIIEQDFRSIWMDSPVLKLLREIRVDKNLDKKCEACEVRHFCGGGCRGQALANTGDLYSLSCTCDFDKEQLFEMLWTAAQKPYLFESEAIRQLEFNKSREKETMEVFSKIKDEIIF